jgi:hypothetical protein
VTRSATWRALINVVAALLGSPKPVIIRAPEPDEISQ